MSSDKAVEVKDVVKNFKVFKDKGYTMKELVLFKARRQFEKREVLKGISFSVKKGEAVGIIGQNGCGKSTTLKLLTKIIYPDSGSIHIAGRVSSLLELGAGFHPDMTGRQNIYTNASIFGLNRAEIDARISDIIAFSELEEFIDNPVRTYSSGMYMRLAFAVAINVDADVLLIDEILAVGDANFQTKCFNRLKEIKKKGTTIIIVSHSLGQIEQICEKSIWIEKGRIKEEGTPREVHAKYLEFMENLYISNVKKEAGRKKENANKDSDAAGEEDFSMEGRRGNGYIRIKDVVLRDREGNSKTTFKTGENLKIEVSYKINKKISNVMLGMEIIRDDGISCYGTNTIIDNIEISELERDGKFCFDIGELELLNGNYFIDVTINQDTNVSADFYRDAKRFQVISTRGEVGMSRMEHRWIV